MAWLIDRLRRSTAQWKILAQQVVVAPINGNRGDDEREPSDPRDNWDGYPEDRARLLGEIERAGVDNVVFLTGDCHMFMANLLAPDFAALGAGTRPPVAVEYAGGSVTSPRGDPPDPSRMPPWNRQLNFDARGYAVMGLDQGQLVTEYRASDVLSPVGGTRTFERFTQPAGANDFTRQSV
jgi:alkaline phosphatase D